MMSNFLLDEEQHPLLEPASPAFSHVTVRRAFIVWLCCGQRNKFKDVCNYFHHLEAMEEKLPADKRAISRHHEFELFSNKPPTSSYLNKNFPQLYSLNQSQPQLFKQFEATNQTQAIKFEGYNEITRQNGTTTEEILATSQMIKNHCQTNSIRLKDFMEEFKLYAEKCELKNTVNNVTFYIQKKMVHDELKLVAELQNFSKKIEENETEEQKHIIVMKSNSLANKENEVNPTLNQTKRAISKSYETLSHENKNIPFAVKNINGTKSFQVLKSDGSLSKSISYVDVHENLKNIDIHYSCKTLNSKFEKNLNFW